MRTLSTGSRPSGRALLSRVRPSAVGMLVMISVLFYIRHTFSTLVAPGLLTAWLVWMWACVLLYCTTVAALLVPDLRRNVSSVVFIRIGQIVALAFCLGIVASVWILMPVADPPLRMLMVLLSMWFIAMVIILNPDIPSIYGALAVVASMATFVVVYRMPYAWALAGFLIGEGAALVAIRRLIWRAADDFEAALAITASERDAKTRFIASASHDLQQPIQAARMFAEGVLRDCDPDHRARAAAGMRASFAAVENLLETMLDHLRLEAETVIPRRERVALQPLFEEVLAAQADSAAQQGIALKSVKTALAVAGDAPLLRRALGNLIGNAIRHSSGTRALIGARQNGSVVKVWVIDNGRGIAPGERERIFEDFVQGAPGSTPGGFGIGLASARRIAELMDGRLELGQRPHRGAAFAIELPCAEKHGRS